MSEVSVTVATNGRIVLPAPLRRRLDVARGGTLIIREEDGRFILENANETIARAQAIVRRFAPNATSVVDEFSAERRADAERDER